MYIDIVPNRSSPPAILLRESSREGGKIRKRTLANLSALPSEAVAVLRRVLKGETLVSAGESVRVERSVPYGHVAAVLGTIRRLKLDQVLGSKRSPERDRVLAMIVARVLAPDSKLATARGLGEDSAFAALSQVLGLEDVSADSLYRSLDWLLERQPVIESKLAAKHLRDGTLLLYDVSSTYLEGRHCPLAAHGYSRDGKPGKMQIVFGLLTTPEGCPVAVEVFAGNTADPATLASAVAKARERFGLKGVVWVADRGLLTNARIEAELRPDADFGWITALRAPAVQALYEEGVLQLSLFDEQGLAEIRSAEFPGERLIACRNPQLGAERARKREALLRATEKELEKVVKATQREKRPLRGAETIGLRVGRVLGRFKMGKHFRLEITGTAFRFERDSEQIEDEARLDGIYVIRTTVPKEEMTADAAVTAYKSLSQVERAFRSSKTDLDIRPLHHHTEPRVRAHVFLCMLAYYVEWHLRRSLAPLLFQDHDRPAAAEQRASAVAPAEISPAARRKKARGRTDDGLPVHSFRTLMAELATASRARVRVGDHAFDQLASLTALQERALKLLEVPWR
ncbi:MAG TPA: IS1634 family transposase [Longimicrobium sp.]|jgi:transposase|uniref:IS1634 family transposase n=1 Tax=Longimicrobium sp. TaxID=2029185 RepID=UPI002EDB5987